MNKKFVYWLLGLVAAVGLFLLGVSYGVSYNVSTTTPPISQIPEVLHSARVLINSSLAVKSYQAVWMNRLNLTALSALQQVTSDNKLFLDFDPPSKSPYGAFVKQIGNEKNGDGNKYWQYWVNGLQPQVAADKYVLQSGDTLLWTFSESTM